MTKKISILIVQTNPIVGNIEYNKQIVVDHIKDNQSDLIVFSELMLTGYPPEDLVLKPAFMDRVNSALSEILECSKSSDATIILGTPYLDKDKLFNAALVIKEGQILNKHYKMALPNYGVFDEKRIFSNGEQITIIDFNGINLGIFICEDIWVKDTILELDKDRMDLAVSLNASPFDVNKIEDREKKALNFASSIDAPLMYVNQVGGQDEIVFDGSSFICDQTKIVSKLNHCVEESREYIFNTIDKAFEVDENDKFDIDKQDIVYSNLILGLRDYVDKNKFPGVVIGISGGIDSAFSAAVAVDALGADRVKGILMPSQFTSDESNIDANLLGKNLEIELLSISIQDIVNSYDNTLSDLFADKDKDITEENIQSRTRGAILMAYSNKFGHMVVTNGNKSEVSVGYSTLYGDMCGGFSVVKDIYKSDLYRLSEWRNTNLPSLSKINTLDIIPKNIILKEPTAELKADQKDSDSLPPYDILDKILFLLVEKESSIKEIVSQGYDVGVVTKVQNLLYNSEYKRRQAAPGVKISERNFGYDRRYPITNAFRDREN
mgnify:CR=1 FL=1